MIATALPAAAAAWADLRERRDERRDPDRRDDRRDDEQQHTVRRPQSAPMSSVVAAMSTVIATTPRANEPSDLPARIDPGRTGPARIRARVPVRRSSNRLTTPAWAAKNRNRIDIDAAK